jgi:pSer/pThr/pTyr-binding forkhead associated (FHA) protein
MPARLVAMVGRADILVDRVMVVVGRHRHCDFRLVSPRVSRWHCCLTKVDGGIWVRDLGSTNGVGINGHRVVSGRLQPGDVLSIAHILYQLEEGEADGARLDDSPGKIEEGGIGLDCPSGHALCDEIDGPSGSGIRATRPGS